MLNGLDLTQLWGWREFEDGLYDVPANANGSIGREAFQEYAKSGGTPQLLAMSPRDKELAQERAAFTQGGQL